MAENRFLARAVLAGLLLLSAGCTIVPAGPWTLDALLRPDVSARKSVVGDARAVGVGVEGGGSAFPRAAAAALSPPRLQLEVAELLAEQRRESAARLVQRYPDVAWQLLRSSPPDAIGAAVLTVISSAHDAQVFGTESPSGWQELWSAREREPESFARYAGRRAEFVARLEQRRPAEALRIELLPRGEDSWPLLWVLDAGQLRSEALVRAGRAAEAAAVLQETLRAAQACPPYYEAQLRLARSEALQQAGQFAGAGEAWQSAVRRAGQALASHPPLGDPGFWQQAVEQRPADSSWPPDVIARLADRAVETGAWCGPWRPEEQATAREISQERVVWACIGQSRLERGEPQAALLAWKRAGALARSERERHHFEWGQARALSALDQPAAATALLLALSEQAGSPTREAALATLGALRLENGNTKQGFQLLRRALEDEPRSDWPGRARAEADLGLAYLLLGHQQAGIEWLQRAQARFERTGDHEQLLVSLLNEQAYWEQAQERPKVRALERRIERWK